MLSVLAEERGEIVFQDELVACWSIPSAFIRRPVVPAGMPPWAGLLLMRLRGELPASLAALRYRNGGVFGTTTDLGELTLQIAKYADRYAVADLCA